MADGQRLLGPGNGHIAQPPLLLHLLPVADGPHTGEKPVLEAHQEHMGKFQALGGVNGHHDHRIVPLVVLLQIGVQRNFFQKAREAGLCGIGEVGLNAGLQFLHVFQLGLVFLRRLGQEHIGIARADKQLIIEFRQAHAVCQKPCQVLDQCGELQQLLGEKDISFSVDDDLIGKIWKDRPALSCEPVMELDVKWAGETRADKIAKIREQMKAKNADVFVLTSLDDIAWLLNIRGNDIHCCPVVLSYLIMTDTELRLYANVSAFAQKICENLEADGVKIYPYNEVYSYVQAIPSGSRILLSKSGVNSRLVSNIPADAVILDEVNLTLLPKAVKNSTEMENERFAHIKDGVAVTKFIHWLKTNVAKETITELSAAEKLYQFRSEQEHFLGDSFDPIIAYGTHAAIVHYSATKETDIPLEAKGMVLADTGGHYLEGTTDITRTIVLGPVSDKEKKYFTAVLRGNLNLAAAKFKYGCTGLNFDYLARGPLWELGEDYNHGTGHGVGYLLNVHEGPNGFRWKNIPDYPAPILEEGMLTSDEPGYYLEGEFGIRHENLVLCRKAEKTSFGQFMRFETLTMVPFDLEGIDPKRMSDHERKLLNDYHRKVYETITPYLNEDEKEWLKQATREI